MTVKKLTLFMPVFIIQAFFSISVFAGSIPATTSNYYNAMCNYDSTSVLLAEDVTQGVYTDEYKTACAGNVSFPSEIESSQHPGVMCPQTVKKWGGSPGVPSSDPSAIYAGYNCPVGNSMWVFLAIVNFQLQQHLECNNPAYPSLDGNYCFPASVVEPECSFDSPIFEPDTTTSYPRMCVLQADGVSYCEYQASTTEGGGTDSRTFTPTSEQCDCTEISPVPCADITDNMISETPDSVTECITGAGLAFCPADPEERCTTDDNGITLCDTNCGYINNDFYCGDTDIPDITSCENADNRDICSGLSEGDCPAGFDCSETTQEPPPMCTSGDTREVCNGLGEGDIPPQTDVSGIETQLQENNSLLEQSNQNTNSIKQLLEGKGMPDLEAQLNTGASNLQTNINTGDSDAVEAVGTQSSNETGFLSNNLSDVGYFGSLVSGLTIVPTGSCTPWTQAWSSGKEVTIDICDIAPVIKVLLAWLINVSLFIYIFIAITKRSSPEVK